MPCESRPAAERIARLVLEHFRIPWIKVDLTPEYHALLARYNSSGALQDQLFQIVEDSGDDHLLRRLLANKARAAGNIKVRLRMITLYHIAQLTGGLVVSTDNLSEFWMGFWTLNGDVVRRLCADPARLERPRGVCHRRDSGRAARNHWRLFRRTAWISFPAEPTRTSWACPITNWIG